MLGGGDDVLGEDPTEPADVLLLPVELLPAVLFPGPVPCANVGDVPTPNDAIMPTAKTATASKPPY